MGKRQAFKLKLMPRILPPSANAKARNNWLVRLEHPFKA
jgi:hypothetical protein